MRIKPKLPSPKTVLMIGCVIVGASTFLYGTEIALRGWLSVFVALTTVGVLETIIPGSMSEWQNPYAYLLFGAVATSLNLTLFFPPALTIVRVYEKCAPSRGSFLIIAWLVLYLLSCFVLFPNAVS